MNGPLTVGQVVDQLNEYPRDALLTISVMVQVATQVTNMKRSQESTHPAFISAKVYGTSAMLSKQSSKSEVSISGS